MDKQSVSITEGKATLWAQGYTQSHWRKTPEREGPLSDVMNTPFAIVPGTISVVNDTQKLLQKDIMHGTQL
ncbi:hypothetical protein H8E77_03025 [bacterium]|nr:hypothetical protein [bacterium]